MLTQSLGLIEFSDLPSISFDVDLSCLIKMQSCSEWLILFGFVETGPGFTRDGLPVLFVKSLIKSNYV